MIHAPHRTIRRFSTTAVIALGVLMAPSAHARPDGSAPAPVNAATGGVTRTELQHLPAPLAGFDIVQTRFEIPIGKESGMHSHPGPEIGYIIQGEVDMIFADQPTQHLGPGQPFHIPVNTVHNARNVGNVRTLMLSTYVTDAAQPLATPR